MILLLGASGYVGQAFSKILQQRGKRFLAPVRKPFIPSLPSDGGLELLGKQRKEFAEGKGSEEPSAWESASHWPGRGGSGNENPLPWLRSFVPLLLIL